MEEIFKALASHYIKGMMVHDKLATYYDFLCLRGYKRCHEYQFYKDTLAYRSIQRYYINIYGRLIPDERIDEPMIIPDSWYRYIREDVDGNTKKNAVETGMKKWVEWEQETKSKLEDAVTTLHKNGNVSDALFVNKLLKDVCHELKCAERCIINLASSNYDMVHIIEEQTAIHDYYKAKMKRLEG